MGECLHQCQKCGGLYSDGDEDCGRRFNAGKCSQCFPLTAFFDLLWNPARLLK